MSSDQSFSTPHPTDRLPTNLRFYHLESDPSTVSYEGLSPLELGAVDFALFVSGQLDPEELNQGDAFTRFRRTAPILFLPKTIEFSFDMCGDETPGNGEDVYRVFAQLPADHQELTLNIMVETMPGLDDIEGDQVIAGFDMSVTGRTVATGEGVVDQMGMTILQGTVSFLKNHLADYYTIEPSD